MIPLVAIVGRPNVGKSTLFNRLVGRRLAIVDDTPGVTRDRHYADTFIQGRDLSLVDTGGFDPYDTDPLRQGIARHVQAAIAEADVVLCVLDAQGAPTEADRHAVQLLRGSDKPVVYFANRADHRELDYVANELFALGIERLISGSALHGRGIAQLEAAIHDQLPEAGPPADTEAASPIPRISLIGRPNAGKSSLLNRLTGSERSLVDDRPGTTRDPIDGQVEFDGRSYVFVDTAGVRRKSKVREAIESASIMRSIRSIDRADVVVLMCDGSETIAEQDARLLSLANERGKALIVGLNKMDLLSHAQQQQQLTRAREALHFVPWVPIAALSAKTGRGTRKLLKLIDQAYEQYGRRIPTAELNRFFAEVLERKPPPTQSGKAPRLYYVTQAQTNPPVFVAMCSAPEAINESYRRFVVNQLRAAFGFDSIPIAVRYRARRRRQ